MGLYYINITNHLGFRYSTTTIPSYSFNNFFNYIQSFS